MGNTDSNKNDEVTLQNARQHDANINNTNTNNTPIQEPTEIQETDEIEWLIKNRYHKRFWEKAILLQQDHRKWDQQTKIRKRLSTKGEYDIPQERKLDENKEKIEEMNGLTYNYYTKDKLTKIIKKCELIKVSKIPNDILSIMIEFVGNGMIAIHYTLSGLPWMRLVTSAYRRRHHSETGEDLKKVYQKTMQTWWDEARLSRNHCCIFYPTNIKTAATEFTHYLLQRLRENGDCLKYQDSMIPHMKIDKKYNIFNRNKHIKLSLPTMNSKCIGGTEMFQRLYLEAALNGTIDGDIFEVDLERVEETHGDDWCFDANGLVLMANGNYTNICELKVGDKVRCFPNSIATVECVIVSNINDRIKMVRLYNNCWITFEHPVLVQKEANIYSDNECNIIDLDEDKFNKDLDGHVLDSDVINKYGLFWVLPTEISCAQYRYQDKIYNFILDAYHTINVSGNWCCTLGHDYKGSVIQHEFWGDSAVIKSFLQSKSNTYPNVVF